MNDHDTAREQLIDAIMDSADQRHMEDEAGQWDYFNCAVIAHLWQAKARTLNSGGIRSAIKAPAAGP